MIYLKLENASKSYGEKTLFSDINFQISKGQKIALVAKNGSGKTTLLRLLATEISVEGERAKFYKNPNVRIGYLKQEPDIHPDLNVLDAALDSKDPKIRAIKAYEDALADGDAKRIEDAMIKVDELKAWNIEARMKEVLGKLKVTQFDQLVGTLSGGQLKRLALAKLIIDEPEFLILDEPTNHLDTEMIEWLEQYLQTANRTLFMVTHDRYFLENVCNHIVEIDNGELVTYRGNYTNYLEKKAAKQDNEAANLDKTKKLFKRELNWIRRQPKARGTKAKSRVDKFHEIKEKASKKLDDEALTLNLDTQRLGSKILELHAVQKTLGELPILTGFDYKFKKGEKVGIVGKNGVGKSTFLKVMTKEMRPDGGKVVLGDTVVFGHYTQEGMTLSEDKMVIEVVRDIAEYIPLKKGLKLTALQLLERFLFPKTQHRVFVSQLSGGERRRLHLLTILMKNPNFLILDEPTNDLDIVTLNVLEDYLMQFPGCVIIVSHDRYFLDKIVDHIFIMEGEGVIVDYNGTYQEYKIQKKNNKGDSDIRKSDKKEDTKPVETEDAPKRKLHYLEKKEMQDLEKSMAKLEKKKTTIEAKFTEAGIDNETITKLSIELGELKKTLEDQEMRWLELSEYE